MNEGTIMAEFTRDKFSQQAILQYAIKDRDSIKDGELHKECMSKNGLGWEIFSKYGLSSACS